MKASDILAKIDHTLLSATATTQQIDTLCEEAIACKTAAVCIPPCYVSYAAQKYGNKLKIATVIGFPLGYDTTISKVVSARQAISDGADEVDMVLNISALKNGNISYVTQEVASVKSVVGEKILKVIIEACYLTEIEKITACKCVTEGGADFIKTSTGFGSGGATHEDVRLIAANIGPNVKIKAAGGISTVDDMKKYIEEGCSRIGASRAVELLKDRINEDVENFALVSDENQNKLKTTEPARKISEETAMNAAIMHISVNEQWPYGTMKKYWSDGDRLAIEYETGKVLYYALEDGYWEPENGWVILPE